MTLHSSVKGYGLQEFKRTNLQNKTETFSLAQEREGERCNSLD